MMLADAFLNDRRGVVSTMQDECGAPAFDNIDDLLADKIINHSRNHSDQTEKETSKVSPSPQSNSKNKIDQSRRGSGKLLIVVFLIILGLFFYQYYNYIRNR